MPPPPRIHSKRSVHDSRFLRVEQVDLEFSNGERRTYERLKGSGLGAVIIVPMRDDDTVLLVREYGAGVDRYELGLPKGRLDRDETVEQGADRELKEEIGYGARELHILHNLSLSPAYMTRDDARRAGARSVSGAPARRRAGGARSGAVEIVRAAHAARRSRTSPKAARSPRCSSRANISPAASSRSHELDLAGTLRARDRARSPARRRRRSWTSTHGDFAVEHKDDDSPLTAADLAAQHVIVEGLRALDAGHAGAVGGIRGHRLGRRVRAGRATGWSIRSTARASSSSATASSRSTSR